MKTLLQKVTKKQLDTKLKLDFEMTHPQERGHFLFDPSRFKVAFLLLACFILDVQHHPPRPPIDGELLISPTACAWCLFF